MASSSQLQSRIRAELARRFGNDRATEIMAIVIDENGFDDDDNLKEDVKDEDSLLRGEMSAAEFECIQRVCSDSETALSVPVGVAQVARVAQAVNILEFLSKKDRSGWSTTRKDTLTLYMRQLPLAITGHEDASFLNLFTLGRYQKNFPLMMCIADTFNRRRISQFLRDGSQLQPGDFVNALPFYAKLSEPDNAAAKFDVTAALESYKKRFIEPLELKPTELFLDKVDDILRYIYSVSKMLHSVLVRREMDLKDELNHDYDQQKTINLPFQFDLVIIPHGKKKKLNIFQVLDQEDDEDEDDEDEEDNGKEKGVDKPVTANIASGLKKFGIKSQNFVMQQDILEDVRKCKRLLKERFFYLGPHRSGRYVMVVDRRVGNSPDKVYAFSPKCGAGGGGGDDDEKANVAHVYHQLHQDFVPESLVYKTLKCLIPSASASAEGPHFGCHQRDCITISFHILANDLKKCYMFINGTGARIEATDLIELLPTFFGDSANDFKRQDVETDFGLELRDEQFTNWYNKTTTMS